MIKLPAIVQLWQREFRGYNSGHFRSDLLAGLTVAAVALPLALAFGIASQATAAAGLITAIVAGLVIGALGGAPYQISGPTGAMAAVLMVIVQRHGLAGLWMASLIAALIILLLGIGRLGRLINFIPAPVITGFTSGIALIIAIGQIDNFLGIKTPAAESAAIKLLNYVIHQPTEVNGAAIVCAAIVIATMLLLPRFRYTAMLPAALIGIVLATAVAWVGNFQVGQIGALPASLLPDDRFGLGMFDWGLVGELIGPAVAIAALGSIESLLAGTVAGRMTGIKLDANQELIAQGIGNLLLPFVGGVPATAAIARMSVGVKAGGMTRLVSIIHALALLLCAVLLSGVIARIPLAALAGVLMITAWRMNEWHVIRFYFKQRLKSAVAVLIVTMLATVALDLTQAIVIGIVLQSFLFISQVSNLSIIPSDVDWERLRDAGHGDLPVQPGIKVIYVSGPIFFGAAQQLAERIESLGACPILILSMRGVPIVDTSGLHVLEQIWQRQAKSGGQIYLTGLQEPVRTLLQRAGFIAAVGEEHFVWSADQAIRQASLDLASAGVATRQREIAGVDEPEDLPLGVVGLA